jgi:hypothetical protein
MFSHPNLEHAGESMSDYAPRMIRFIRANLDVGVDSCIAVVEVETPGFGRFVGSAQGGISEADQTRTVARATADALSDAFQTQNAHVRVLGVQVVEAIPYNAVMVTLAASKGPDSRTLHGICDGDAHDTPKATALAVLNATNRFLSLQ